MRRNVRSIHYHTNNTNIQNDGSAFYQTAPSNEVSDLLELDMLPRNSRAHRFENTIEAKVEKGETLQALALRFNCTVADIKRLNKIDKDNEIYARNVVKIPVTIHSVLLNTTLPGVHKSGNNSPRHEATDECAVASTSFLNENNAALNEKLLVASVNASGATADIKKNSSINQVILNSKITPGTTTTDTANVEQHDVSAPLLTDLLDDETIPQLRPIRGPSMRTIDWSGSDCDMSWVCLFILILALCFAIPLIYVIYIAEHPHHHNHTALH